MTEESFKICDICKKKVGGPDARSPHDPWMYAHLKGYYCGSHSVLGMGSNYTAAGSSADLCSGPCALAWLEARIEQIKKMMAANANNPFAGGR